MALASDVNNREYIGAIDPDSVMIARFYKRPIKLVFQSEKEGRSISEDVIYCEYYPAGSTILKMDVPAHESHKQRFAKQWAYYQSTQGGDSRMLGTTLDQWPILSPADVENLRGLKFNTVENIAGCSDLMLQTLGMGIASMSPHVLRAKAQAFLGSAQDTALPQKQAADIEALKKQVADLTELLTQTKDNDKTINEREKIAQLEALASAKGYEKKKKKLTPEHLAAMKAGREKAKQKVT